MLLYLDALGVAWDMAPALYWTCSNGHLSMAQWLVAQDADVHVLNDEPLHAASRDGHLVVVQWLVAQGGYRPHALNRALHWACRGGQIAVAQGANVNVPTDEQRQWLSAN